MLDRCKWLCCLLSYFAIFLKNKTLDIATILEVQKICTNLKSYSSFIFQNYALCIVWDYSQTSKAYGLTSILHAVPAWWRLDHGNELNTFTWNFKFSSYEALRLWIQLGRVLNYPRVYFSLNEFLSWQVRQNFLKRGWRFVGWAKV